MFSLILAVVVPKPSQWESYRTYICVHIHPQTYSLLNQSIENILSSHRYLHFQPNISGFILFFSFSLFLTTFSVRTLVSIFLSRFTYFSKTPIYNKVPIALSCVHIFFTLHVKTLHTSSLSLWATSSTCLDSDTSGHCGSCRTLPPFPRMSTCPALELNYSGMNWQRRGKAKLTL